MSIYEYDEELHMRQTREEGREEGIAEGKSQSILTLLEDIGNIPPELKQMIFKEKDSEILKTWVKLAARANSIEEFQTQIGSTYSH